MNKLKPGDAHVIFNGPARELKFFVVGDESGQPRHTWECHDVGVADGTESDPYGYKSKCPPGVMYPLGAPQPLNPPEPAYGTYFTPIDDDASGDMAKHHRDGIGIHGGGSDLADPFAPRQGWEWTFGCLRLQNEDNEQFVRSVAWIQSHGGTVYLDVVWDTQPAVKLSKS